MNSPTMSAALLSPADSSLKRCRDGAESEAVVAGTLTKVALLTPLVGDRNPSTESNELGGADDTEATGQAAKKRKLTFKEKEDQKVVKDSLKAVKERKKAEAVRGVFFFPL